MLNGWELLLKAQILKNNNEDLKSIYIEDKDAKKKNGLPFRKPKYKKNSSGGYRTKGINTLINQENIIDVTLKKQLKALIEIRNCCSHLVLSPVSKKTTLTVFAASLKSYMAHLRLEFGEQIEDELYLIPIALNIPHHFSSSIDHAEEYALLDYISKAHKSTPLSSQHQICVDVEIKFIRSEKGVKVSRSKDGIPIFTDSEEVFMNLYPWSYKEHLLPALKKYSNFISNKRFHSVKKELEQEEKFCGTRYLDWNKKSGSWKRFYNPNIVKELEKRLGLEK